MIRFLLFLGILLFLFNQITPYLYRLLPNDYVRTRLIWSTLNNPEERPDLVILGNSRGTSGVHGIPPHPLGCCSGSRSGVS